MPDQPGYLPSNGTEGDMFMGAFCHRCTKDSIGTNEEGVYCFILSGALCGEPQDAWVHDPSTGYPGNARCLEFEALEAQLG